MDCIVRGVAEVRTGLSDFRTFTFTHLKQGPGETPDCVRGLQAGCGSRLHSQGQWVRGGYQLVGN